MTGSATSSSRDPCWAPGARRSSPTWTRIPDDPLDVSTLSRDPSVGKRYTADPLVRHGPARQGIEQVERSDLSERLCDDARHEVFNETDRDDVLETVTAFARRHV